MKRSRKLAIVIITAFLTMAVLYTAGYVVYRISHLAVYGTRYVIFPKEPKLLSLFYRPLALLDAKLTGIGIHLGRRITTQEYKRDACINNMKFMIHVPMCQLGYRRHGEGERDKRPPDYSARIEDLWEWGIVYRCPSGGRYSIASLTNWPVCSMHGECDERATGTREREFTLWRSEFNIHDEVKKNSAPMTTR